jgi:hypothetical protein
MVAAGRRAAPLEVAARALSTPGIGTVVAISAVTALLGVPLNLTWAYPGWCSPWADKATCRQCSRGSTGWRRAIAGRRGVGLAVAGLTLVGAWRSPVCSWRFEGTIA